MFTRELKKENIDTSLNYQWSVENPDEGFVIVIQRTKFMSHVNFKVYAVRKINGENHHYGRCGIRNKTTGKKMHAFSKGGSVEEVCRFKEYLENYMMKSSDNVVSDMIRSLKSKERK